MRIINTRQVHKHSLGFGLLEVMITISIVATLALLTEAPARDFINQQNIATTQQTLIAQLRLARSEARLRHQVVRLCQSDDFKICTNNRNWNQGWIIYTDLDKNGKRTVDEPLLQGQNKLHDAMSIRLFAGGRARSVKIDEWGVIRTSGRFEVCAEHMNKSVQTISFTRSGYLRPGISRNTCTF